MYGFAYADCSSRDSYSALGSLTLWNTTGVA